MKIEKDKKIHFVACLAVAMCITVLEVCIGTGAFGAWLAGFIGGTACGVGKEYGDYRNPNNKWDNYDLLVDVLGALAGGCVGLLALLL